MRNVFMKAVALISGGFGRILCSMYCKKTATWKHINVFKKGHQKTIRLGQKEYILDKDIADWRI